MQAHTNTYISGTRWFFCIINSMYRNNEWRDHLNPSTIFEQTVVRIHPALASLRFLLNWCIRDDI